jgi:LuxR family transcriptional regulator, quorum-sensing system regulator BjaR1
MGKTAMGLIRFSKVSAFAETCLTAARVEDIRAALTTTLGEAGVTSWYVGPLVHESDLPPGAGQFGMPRDWQEQYADARHCEVDPVFLHAKRREGPSTWSACRERAEYEGACGRALRVFDEAEDYDLFDGFIMPTLGPDPLIDGVTFGGRRPDLSMTGQLNLQLLGTYAYEGFRRLAEGFKRASPRLTQRQLDVLCWSAEGKTAWEIGEILQIGVRTVRTHQAAIKEKYQVSTMVQAAVRAALDGTVPPPL